jgi:hypothetical protein
LQADEFPFSISISGGFVFARAFAVVFIFARADGAFIRRALFQR